MNISRLGRPLLVAAGFVLFAFSNWAGAEPPMRAARLGYATGTVSFSPAGDDQWVRAMINRPLTLGDRLWVDAGARAEVQLGGASIRLGSATSVTLLNIDDRMTQLQLTEGALRIKVRRMGPGEAFEIDTPNLAFYISRPGDYRINVDANGDATAVRVISGRAEAYGEGASYAVGSQQGYRFYGTGLSDYDRLAGAAWRDDDLDRWALERERRYANSASAHYVSYDVVGYEDLDSYGRWQRDPEYGQVWTPTRVSAGWAPFRDGHWSWVDPWGWTWVDDAPWGYAVSHYGRWANRRGTWVWVPGPQRERAAYAPAQVAFVGNFGGGASISIAVGGLIGWFALAPHEVYQPSYQVSRSYFDRINRSNAVVAPSNITVVYNNYTSNRTTNVTYANQRVRGGVVAVPTQTFTQSQPVAKASTQASSDAAAKGQVAHAAPVAPEHKSVQGGAPAASAQPAHRERRVVARTAPPPPPPAFAAQQEQLHARPGRPIDEAQRRQLKPAAAAAAAAPAVSVVTTAKAPAAAPPATAPAPKSAEQRRSESAKADAGRPEGQRGEGRRTDAAKAEAPKGDTAKADAAKADTAKADAAKADAAKADAARADAAKADAAKGDAARKADSAKRDRDRDEARKSDAAKVDAAKGDAMKAEAAKAAAARNEAARAEAAKADAVKAEAARIDAAKAAAAKADASRAQAAKAEASRAEGMKAEAAKAAAAKADAARAEAAKADAARAEAAKAEAGRAAAAKAEAGRAEAARAQAAQAAAAKAEAGRAEAAKAQAAQAAAAKAQAAQAEAARAQAAKAQAAQAEAAKAQAAQAAAAKAAQAQAAQAAAAKAQAAQAAQAAAAAKATGAAGAAVKGDASEAEKAARKAAREAKKAEEEKK